MGFSFSCLKKPDQITKPDFQKGQQQVQFLGRDKKALKGGKNEGLLAEIPQKAQPQSP